MFNICFEMRGFPLESNAEEVAVNVIVWLQSLASVVDPDRAIIMEILPLATVVKKDSYQSLIFMGNADVTKAKAGERYQIHRINPYYHNNSLYEIVLEMNMKPNYTQSP